MNFLSSGQEPLPCTPMLFQQVWTSSVPERGGIVAGKAAMVGLRRSDTSVFRSGEGGGVDALSPLTERSSPRQVAAFICQERHLQQTFVMIRVQVKSFA